MRKFIVLIYLIPFIGFSQERNRISVPVIEIADSNFYNLLDSVLELDKSCNYFSNTVSYYVSIYDTIHYDYPFHILTFEGKPNKSYFFSYWGNHFGCIKYNKHYFFVQNKSYLFENELILTKKKYLFDDAWKDKYPLNDDDSWAIRYFGYCNGIFYYLGSINDDVRCK